MNTRTTSIMVGLLETQLIAEMEHSPRWRWCSPSGIKYKDIFKLIFFKTLILDEA